MRNQKAFTLVEIFKDMKISFKDFAVIGDVCMDEGLWP